MKMLLFSLSLLHVLVPMGTQSSGENVTPIQCPTLSPPPPKEKNMMAMAWVRSAVPVSIVKLFLEDDGPCLRVQKLNGKNNKEVKNMCEFVKVLTTEYVNASSARNGGDSDSYVLQAMRRADSYSNNVTCNCLMANDIREKTLAYLEALAGSPLIKVSAAVSSTFRQIAGVFALFSKSTCETLYKGWEDVCGVTVLLLDSLPDEQQQVPTASSPSPCPTLQAPPPCNCCCNQSDSDVTSGCHSGLVPVKEEKNQTNTTTSPTATQPKPSKTTSKPPQVQPSPESNGNTEEESTSIPGSFLFVAIAVVLAAFLGYVGYYNREYLTKQFGGLCSGRKDGRPKKKNYKHLKSVKDALP